MRISICQIGKTVLAGILGSSVFLAMPTLAQQPTPASIYLNKVIAKKATIQEIQRSLSLNKPGDVANIMHALYSMRHSPIVRNLLRDLWYENQQAREQIPWQRLRSPVIRVALASTIHRIFPGVSDEFVSYIRAQGQHQSFLVRAQVAIALGLSGEPQDVALLASYLDGESDYVADSAVVGLAYMYNQEAKQSLIQAIKRVKDKKRLDLIREALLRTYNWVATPTKTPVPSG